MLYSAFFAYEALLRQAACGSSALSALSNLVRQMVLTGRQLLMLGLTTSSSKVGMTNVERCRIIWSTTQFKTSKLGLPSSANVANHRERHMGYDFLSVWPSFSLQTILLTHSWPSLCTSQSRALLSFEPDGLRPGLRLRHTRASSAICSPLSASTCRGKTMRVWWSISALMAFHDRPFIFDHQLVSAIYCQRGCFGWGKDL